MRNTGPVKFENDLRKSYCHAFKKMKKLHVPLSIQKINFCPIHGKKEVINAIRITF